MGACAASRLESASERVARGVATVLLLALAALAAALAWNGSALMTVPRPAVWIGGMLALTGAVVAAQFVVVAGMLRARGMDAGQAAAWTDVADYGGSMLGALLGGVVLVPVAGITGACGVTVVLCCLACIGCEPFTPIRRE